MSVVYFVAAGNPPVAVKIGHSYDVRSRINGIRTGNHLPVRLLGTVPGGLSTESRITPRLYGCLRERASSPPSTCAPSWFVCPMDR